jgi:hypothetical protein
MSEATIASMEQGKPFLQSPADDFESFFYVLQWAAVFLVPPDGKFTSEQQRLQHLVTGTVAERSLARQEISLIMPTSPEYSAALASTGDVFLAYDHALVGIRRHWASELTHTLQYRKLVGQVGEELHALMLPFYHLYAYRVVKMYLQILCDHESTLKSVILNLPAVSS